MPPIYLDNAASTRVGPEVLALMTEVMQTAWGNPSSVHPQGVAAREHIAKARARVLAAIGDGGATPRGDVVWTSGCSEADALAVLGAARVHGGAAIVMTAIEHPAVTATAARVGKVVEVAAEGGVIDPEALARAVVDSEAGTVAIVMVQNEIGVVQPVAAAIAAVRATVKGRAVHIHVDAAQALGKVAIDVGALGCDSIAFAGHKLHGPKGVGALWLRSGARLEPLWVGGGQQGGLRGGTQDAPGAAGFGLAAERAVAQLPAARARWLEYAAHVIETAASVGARSLVPDTRRAPHILALGLPRTPAAAIRNVLASRGVYISTGSACSQAGEKPSHVLQSIGLPDDTGMVRFSFALDTTEQEVRDATAILVEAARSLAGAAA